MATSGQVLVLRLTEGAGIWGRLLGLRPRRNMKREGNSVLISLQRKQAPLWKLSLREHAHGTYQKMKFTVEILPFGRMLTHRPYLHWIFTHEALQIVFLGDTAGRRRVVRVAVHKGHQRWALWLSRGISSCPVDTYYSRLASHGFILLPTFPQPINLSPLLPSSPFPHSSLHHILSPTLLYLYPRLFIHLSLLSLLSCS